MNTDEREKLTDVEIAAIKWQYDLYGDFFTNLFKAIVHADSTNFAKLEKGFPVEVAAYRNFHNESGWWEKVEAKLSRVGGTRVVF